MYHSMKIKATSAHEVKPQAGNTKVRWWRGFWSCAL